MCFRVLTPPHLNPHIKNTPAAFIFASYRVFNTRYASSLIFAAKS